MSDANYNPYSLTLNYSNEGSPSALTAPYNVTLTFDADSNSTVYFIGVNGFDGSSVGFMSIRHRQRFISLSGNGLYAGSIGHSTIYNLKQFARPASITQVKFGQHYLQGGVKWLIASGANTSRYGSTLLVNTTANKNIIPVGISPPVAGTPVVSPRFVYTAGISPIKMPNPSIREALLKTLGANSYRSGNQTVWYHTRPLQVGGINSYATGYPDVFDPVQFVQQSLFNRTAVFGDVNIKNATLFIKGVGISSQSISEWAITENKNRSIAANGFLSQSFGFQSIKNKSPSIFFNGLPAPTFSNQAIGYRIKSVKASGSNSLLVGNPSVTKTPELSPFGFTSSGFGTQWVSNRRRYIVNTSKDHSSVSSPRVWFRYRHLQTTSLNSLSVGSSTTVTHGIREVISKGFTQQGYGSALVTRGLRFVAPQSISFLHASRHYVGRHQEIKPNGYIATQFGTRIIPESRSIYPNGFIGLFGQNTISMHTRYIQTKGYLAAGDQPAFRWGRQIVYNLTQKITQNFDAGGGLVPPKWPDWTAIQNRNKSLGVVGHLSQKLGYARAYNNASQALVLAINPLVINKPMVSQKTRFLFTGGIEPIVISGWGVVHNAAKVITPASISANVFGIPNTVKTRRYYNNIGGVESFESGVAMIAYRIRRVDIETRYSIAPPQIKLPTIDTLTKYTAFKGYETAKYGLPSLAIHFNIIRASWAHRDNAGIASVKNLTPELRLYGHNSQLFGLGGIRTQWRNVYTLGNTATLFGRVKIADTKQFVLVNGWRDIITSQKHTVVRTGAPLYSQQSISLDGWVDYSSGQAEYIEGNGINSENSVKGNRVPIPSLNQNVLYAKGYVASSYGTQFIWSNNIYIASGIAIHNIGDNVTVSNKNNFISNAGSISSSIDLGKPRLSPHTIYSVVEAPAQAISNHGDKTVGKLHYVGSASGRQPGFIVGIPKIESTIRGITVPGSWFFDMGKPSVRSTLREIRPKSFKFSNFGLPKIPFTLQVVTPFGSENPLTRWGSPSVSIIDKGDKSILVSGIYSTAISRCRIDLFKRFVGATGVNTQAMGSIKSNDKPYMWQGLRVGAHVPTSIGGGDMFLSGNSLISLRVRQVDAVGFNAFVSRYDPIGFNERMRVTLVKPPIDNVQRVNVYGINHSSVGNANAIFGQYFIRPDGNSDQFRKGGYHA